MLKTKIPKRGHLASKVKRLLDRIILADSVWAGRLHRGHLVSVCLCSWSGCRRENLLQISSLQAEMERSKEAPRPRRQPPPPPPHLLPLQHDTRIHAPLSLAQHLQSNIFTRLSKRPLQTTLVFHIIVAFKHFIS